MPLARLAINRPVGTLMVVLIIVFLGLVALFNIPADLLPEMDFPAVAVITDYEGAGPFEVETLVSRPLEEALATVGQVEEISSESLEGTSIILTEFDWGTDVDIAALEVREAIDQVRDHLPDDASAPVVLQADPGMMPVMRITLSGPYDLVELTQMAELAEDRLERIEGVASVDLEGEVQEEVRVEVDPDRLNAHGLTHMQVVEKLAQENLDLPGGDVEEAGERLSIRTLGEFISLDDIRSVTLSTPRGGSVTLDELAAVQLHEAEQDSRSRLDGSPAVTLSITEQSGANTVEVAGQIRAALDELRRELPGDAGLTVVRDQSRFIDDSIATVTGNVVFGGLLAIIILYLFLTDVRTVLVIGLGIPVSVIATFAFMYFSDITLNLVSMGGLALGVGMLVDNAIVILENVFRHREEGLSPAQAALYGTGEVAGAVTGSTITTIAVFVPVLFIEGLAAQIFRQLAMTISFSLGSSLFVSLTFIPMVAAIFLRQPPQRRGGIAQRSADIQEKMAGRYDAVVRGALKRRPLVLGLVLVLLGAAVWGATAMPSVFLPDMDQREIDVQVELPRGATVDRTDEIVQRVEDIVEEREDVQHVYAASGQSLGGGGLADDTAPDEGALLIRLIDRGRDVPETEEVIADLRDEVRDIPGADIHVSLASGMAGEDEATGEPVAVSVRGDDLDLLRETSQEIEDIIRNVPGTTDVRSSYEEGAPEAQLHLSRHTMGRYELTASEVGMMIRGAVEGEVATSYREEETDIDIRVIYPDRYTDDVSSVGDILLPTPDGNIVPVSSLAEVQMEPGPVAISRHGQVRQIEVTADLADRNLSEVMADVRGEVDQLRLPPGYDIHYGGETEELFAAFEILGFAFAAGCVLVYMVLAAQFESLLHPVIVMVTIPLAAIGVVGGLFVWDIPLSVPSIVGVIGMAGIVVNNSIVMIAYIDQLRDRGLKRYEAIARAAGIRLRPILMTSCTTILGLVPMALEAGAGAEMQNAMAVAVLGGLVVSTALTLLVVPCLYATLVREKADDDRNEEDSGDEKSN